MTQPEEIILSKRLACMPIGDCFCEVWIDEGEFSYVHINATGLRTNVNTLEDAVRDSIGYYAAETVGEIAALWCTVAELMRLIEKQEI